MLLLALAVAGSGTALMVAGLFALSLFASSLIGFIIAGLLIGLGLSALLGAPIGIALFAAYGAWLAASGETKASERCARYRATAPSPMAIVLPGPTGEKNTYELHPRGYVLCHAQTRLGALVQLGATLATGNIACFAETAAAITLMAELLKLFSSRKTPES